MDPQRFFQLYLASKAHFQTKSYDIVKYNGRIKNATQEHLDRRNDSSLLYGYARKFDNDREATRWLFANMAYGLDYPFTEEKEVTDANVKKWLKYRSAFARSFESDLSKFKVSSHVELFHDNPPGLLVAYLHKSVEPQTMAVIDHFKNVATEWQLQYPLWKEELLRISKLKLLLPIKGDNEALLLQTWNDFLEEVSSNHAKV